MNSEEIREQVISGLRQDLNTSVIEFAKEILAYPEDSIERTSLMNLKFSDVFGISSLHSQDECLAEMIKPRNLIKLQTKNENGEMEGLKIGDIENLLKCERSLILKTLESLEMRGGMNGWEVKSTGIRRGKKYCLKKKTS